MKCKLSEVWHDYDGAKRTCMVHENYVYEDRLHGPSCSGFLQQCVQWEFVAIKPGEFGSRVGRWFGIRGFWKNVVTKSLARTVPYANTGSLQQFYIPAFFWPTETRPA